MRLVDADALIISDEECEYTMCCNCKMQVNGCADFYDIIKNAPTIEERKTGKWKKTYLDHEAMGERPSIFYCSVCNQCIAFPVNYCPSCGADMRGEKNE